MKIDFSAHVEEHYISVNGIITRYLSAGDGPPVLLIHGIGSFAESWQPLIDHLSPHFRVIAPDLVGFGKSGKPLDRVYTYQTFATFLLAFMNALRLPPVVLAGHSLGGGIALQTAIFEPERVDKLILVSSGGLGREFSLALRLMTLPRLGELIIKPSLKKTLTGLKAGVYDSTLIQDKWVQFRYEMSKLPGASQAFLKTLRDSANLLGGYPHVIDPIVKNLDRITSPALVIWGKDDPVVPFKLSAVAMTGIGRSRLLALEKCGHMPLFEHTEMVLDGISGFLG